MCHLIFLQNAATKKIPKTLNFRDFREAQTGFEPVNRGVADLCLTTWLLRLIHDSDGNRTRVTAVKGRCLNLLTTEPDTI